MQPGNFPSFRNMTQAESIAWMMAPSPQIRLTLTQGTPVTTADVTGATSVFAEPFGGAIVPLFRDTAGKYPCIRKLAPSTLSLALGTLASGTIPNDVFAYDNNGSLGLEKLAWTSTTARATAVDLVDGRYYKNGDYSRLLVGGFTPTATTTTEDSGGGVTTQVGGKRLLFNVYNRKSRWARVIDTTDTWQYLTNTWRQANAASGNKVEVFVGLSEDVCVMNVLCGIFVAGNTGVPMVGIGIDSTTTPSAGIRTPAYDGIGVGVTTGLLEMPSMAISRAYLAVGYHAINWMEIGSPVASGGNTLFAGDDGADGQQSGMSVEVLC